MLGLRKRSRSIWVVAAIVFAMLVGACTSGGKGSSAEQPAGGSGKEPAPAKTSIVLGMPSDPRTLDPHKIQDNTEWNILYHLFEPLVARDPEGEVIPGLLMGWEAADTEKKVWRLKLREGVTFHNGEPWTAEVLQYNFDRVLKEPDMTVKQYLQGITQYKVIDQHTLEITVDTPLSILLNGFIQFAVVPKQYIEQNGADKFGREPVGSGPYKFVQWRKDEHLKLAAYDQYWGAKPAIQDVTIRPIPEPASRVAALVAGEVDLIRGVSIYDVDRVKQNAGTTVVSRGGPRMWHLKMDLFREQGSPGFPAGQRNAFLDPQVRKAVYLAINIDEIIQHSLNGFAIPANQFQAPFIWGHNPNVQRPAYNPDEAKRLLAAAGYPNGFAVRLDVEEGWEHVGEAIVGHLDKVGIKVELNVAPASVYRTMTAKYETSFAFGGWGATLVNTSFDGNVYTAGKEGLGRANYGKFSDPEFDRLTDEARSTFDPDLQLERYRALQAKVADQLPIIPLFHEGIVAGTRTDLAIVIRYNEHIYAQDMKFTK